MTDNAPIWASCATCGEDRFPVDEAMIDRAAKVLVEMFNDGFANPRWDGKEDAAEVLRAALEVTE